MMFSNQWRSSVYFFVFYLAAAYSIPHTAFSADPPLPGGAFVVRPAKVEMAIAPGDAMTRAITLTNSTALPLSVSVSFEDVAPKVQTIPSDDPVVLLGATGGAYPLKELVSTNDQSLTILSGESLDVPVTVRIPKSTLPGGHYGSVVFTFTPILSSGITQNENVAVVSRLATLFYVRVEGTVKEEGKLIEFGIFNNAKTISVPTRDAPLRFNVEFENTGTVHLNPYGRLSISGLFGKKSEILIDPWVILPGGVRMREIDFSESLTIGYYTALLEQNRGYQDIVDTKEVHFWVMPSAEQWLMIIAVVLLLVWLIRRSLSLSRHAVS